jgi:hypothetical protein
MSEQNSSPRTTRGSGKSPWKSIFISIFIIAFLGAGGVYYIFPEWLEQYRPPAQSANETSRAEPLASTSDSTSQLIISEPVPTLPDEPIQSRLATDNQSSDPAHSDRTGPPGRGSPSHRDRTASPRTDRINTAQATTVSQGNSQADADNNRQPVISTASDDVPGETSSCRKMAAPIEEFFTTLDERPYMVEFNLPEPSDIYFPKLMQRLADNPPLVTGETDDLYTILKNTAHFFRIIGKDNILIIKGILDREKPTFEQIIANFYVLLDDPDCLEKQFNLSISKDSLYHYAGFFLDTMGGRLYLFRRDSMSRMVVNYYAVLIIDRANREGRNKYGIDLGGPIDALIDEIESSNIELSYREQYLDDLYDLKERYQ